MNKLISNIVGVFFRKKPRLRTIIKATIVFGIFNFFISKYRDDKYETFENFLSVVAIVKNEGPYIKEWINYHRLVGVEKFYIYDNESTDDTRDILKPYIDSGVVSYKYFPGKTKQLDAYAHCIKKYRRKTKWLAPIDLDEFIVPVTQNSIPDVINDIVGDAPDISQILVGWVVYGSNGHKVKPDGLVLENYTRHELISANKFWHKVILNPRKVYAVHIHSCAVSGKTVTEDLSEVSVLTDDIFTVPESFEINRSKIKINHYAVKSYEEFLIKKYRGDAGRGRTSQIKHDSYFTNYDRNSQIDKSMTKYVKLLKK